METRYPDGITASIVSLSVQTSTDAGARLFAEIAGRFALGTLVAPMRAVP
jgi:hypothetical protein